MIFLPISYIIPTLNRTNSLKKTIVSILKSNYLPSEIIIIDQSDDFFFEDNKKTLDELFEHCQVKLVHKRIFTKSITTARNTGLRISSFDLIVMSDDDVILFDNTLNNIFKWFDDERISLVGCENNSDSKKSESILGYLFGFKSFRKRKFSYVSNSMFGRVPIKTVKQCKTEWAVGFFYAFRKNLALEWQIFFDEKMGSYAYAEDLDFSYRFCQKSFKNGYQCIFDRTINIIHVGTNEFRIPSRTHTFMYVNNRKYLSYKLRFKAISRFYLSFTNNIVLLKRIIKKEAPKDMWDAIRYSKRINKKTYLDANISFGWREKC